MRILGVITLVLSSALGGCAAFLPGEYVPTNPELTSAPPELKDKTTDRPLTGSASAPGARLSAFEYVLAVSDELDAQAGTVNTARQGLAYAGIVGGLGTAISAAAKAAQGVTLGFGAATATEQGLDTAAGVDARSQILSKAQAAIKCLRDAEVILATPVVPPTIKPAIQSFSQQSLAVALAGGISQAVSPSEKEFVRIAQLQARLIADDVVAMNTAIAANQVYATGEDGRLPWFLVVQAWDIWQSAQQQLQAAAGNLKDVLSGVKSALNNQSQQPGSAKNVSDTTKTTKSKLALAAQIQLASSPASVNSLVLIPLANEKPNPSDPGTAADQLFQKLQDTIAKCPNPEAPAPPPKKQQ